MDMANHSRIIPLHCELIVNRWLNEMEKRALSCIATIIFHAFSEWSENRESPNNLNDAGQRCTWRCYYF